MGNDVNNKIPHYWRPSGLLDDILPENRELLSQFLGDVEDTLIENGWQDEDINAHLVFKQIFKGITQGKNAREYPRNITHASGFLTQYFDEIVQDLYDLKYYSFPLKSRFFKQVDLEAEILVLYIKEKLIQTGYEEDETR